MQKLIGFAIIVITLTIFMFGLLYTNLPVHEKPIVLNIGDVIMSSCGSRLYEITSFTTNSNGADLICYRALNGQKFITNQGDSAKHVLDKQDNTCISRSLFLTDMHMQGQKIYKNK